MIDEETRKAIFLLQEKKHGIRAIARALSLSRNSVREVLRRGTTKVPMRQMAEELAPHRDRIIELFERYKGNRVRAHEELAAQGIEVPYTTLTAFLRRHQIGVPEKIPAGRYVTGPGQEMQHDTSPHKVSIGGKRKLVQTAALILAHSRMLFIQCYPTFNRFACKIFLTDAFRFFGGAAKQCIIDNTHVVILRGTGPDAVVVPEMESFAERFGFVFIAHAVGDANRSGKVERPFHYVENNFLVGRTFANLEQLNREAIAWCERSNARYRRHLHAAPVDLFQREKPHLVPLPIHVPDVYDVHFRTVDIYGYVTLHRHRYSAPSALIGRRVEVREYKDKIHIVQQRNSVAIHRRGTRGAWSTLPEHRGRPRRNVRKPIAEEEVLCAAHPTITRYVASLKESVGPRPIAQLRRLHRLYLEYPLEPLCDAVEIALHYGLFDLARLESIVLRRLTNTYFRLPDVPAETDSINVSASEDPHGRQSGPTTQKPPAEANPRDLRRRDQARAED